MNVTELVREAKGGDVLGSVYYTKEPGMVQKKGKPVAVTISPEAFGKIEQQQEDVEQRFWQTVDRIRERNGEKDPEEEVAFITGVVDEVRQERHDAAQRQTKGRR